MKEYHVAVSEWESRMVDEGKIHLLPKNKIEAIKQYFKKPEVTRAKMLATVLKKKIIQFKRNERKKERLEMKNLKKLNDENNEQTN